MGKNYKPVLGYIEKAWAVYRKNFWDIIKANLLIFLIPAFYLLKQGKHEALLYIIKDYYDSVVFRISAMAKIPFLTSNCR